MRRNLGLVNVLLFIGMLVCWAVLTDDLLAFLPYLLVSFLLAGIGYKSFIKRYDRDFSAALYVCAFLCKLLFSAARYYVLIGLYRGGGDAARYLSRGMALSEDLLSGQPTTYTEFKAGTIALDYLCGALFTVFPASIEGAYVLFATLAFFGAIFFYRAFLLAFPEGRKALFRGLIFFLPSILFWPASLGKDALIFLGLGLVAYGFANLLLGRLVTGGYWLFFGFAITAIIRPHVAGFAVIAMGFAMLIGKHRGGSGRWLIGSLGLAVVGIYLVQFSTEFLASWGLTSLDWEGLQAFYEKRRASSFGGGSAVLPPFVLTLLGPIYAVVTVLLRPFIWEAGNPQSIITSLESMFWLWLFWRYRKGVWFKLCNLRRYPFTAFALAFSLIMIVALTSLGNFGIIARQRVMFLPFLLMLLA